MQQAQAQAEMEAHFDAIDEAAMEPGGALHFDAAEAQANPAQVLVKVCGLYRTVRPFLNFAANFFLVPAKVKNVIKTFTGLMDGLCPES
jgi:hypothetical protein